MSKILFVDDDPALLATYPRLLRREPYDVVVAASGRAALEILERDEIDLVISDEQMPEMKGTELLEHVRLRNPTIGRIILTGEPGSDQDVQARAVDRVMFKPSSPQDLKAAIVASLQLRTALAPM
jgi:CheY-like chemotaxis protein